MRLVPILGRVPWRQELWALVQALGLLAFHLGLNVLAKADLAHGGAVALRFTSSFPF